MSRREYHVEQMRRRFDSYESAGGADLDSFGKEGWRVVQIVAPASYMPTGTEWVDVLFERKVPRISKDRIGYNCVEPFDNSNEIGTRGCEDVPKRESHK